MGSKNTIEVPVELIEAGDIDAIRKLVPVSGLFGRWATHPEHGRVLIADNRPDRDGKVCIARTTERFVTGSAREWVPFGSLTLDPVELTTEQDFRDAPEGTIVTQARHFPREKFIGGWASDGSDDLSCEDIAKRGTWQVLRWGEGEEA